MRTALLVAVVVALARTASAQEAPPPPPLEEAPPPAAEVAPLIPVEEPPPPIEPPTDKKPADFTPAPAPKAAEPKKDPAKEDSGGFGGSACWGSSLGCVVGGCLPGAGTALGATILISMIGAGLSEGGCGGVILVIFGAIYGIAIGAPSALLLGPCSACPAAAGGVTAAWLEDRSIWPAVLGSLPGLALATLGTAGTVWGLFSLDGSTDMTVPAAILGTSAALSLLSGPATVAGVVLADGMAGPAPPDAKPAEKKPVPKPEDPRKDAGTSQVAMRY